ADARPGKGGHDGPVRVDRGLADRPHLLLREPPSFLLAHLFRLLDLVETMERVAGDVATGEGEAEHSREDGVGSGDRPGSKPILALLRVDRSNVLRPDVGYPPLPEARLDVLAEPLPVEVERALGTLTRRDRGFQAPEVL